MRQGDARLHFRLVRRLIGVADYRRFRSGTSVQAGLSSWVDTRSRQGSFAPPALPSFIATMNPSDSRIRRTSVMSSDGSLSATAQSPIRTRVSQVPGSSLFARRPLTPRGARSLHMLVASRSMLASSSLAGWPLPLLNGAELGSLALRLTNSPSEASTTGLLHSPLGKLPGNEQFPGQARFILSDHPSFS